MRTPLAFAALLGSIVLATDAVGQTRSGPKAPTPGLDPSVSEAQVWLTKPSTDAIAIFDSASHTIISTANAGDSPERIVFSPKGHRAYVTNRLADTVSVIDTASHATLGAPIAVGDNPLAIAVAPNGQRLYVGIAAGLQVIDTTSRQIIATIPLAAAAGAVAVSNDNTRVFVANSSLVVIDATTNTITSTLYPGHFTTNVVLSPNGERIYAGVTNYYDDPFGFYAAGGIVVLDAVSLATVGTAWTGSLPGAIAFAPNGGEAYVALTHTWVNTGYGAGFAAARHVATINTNTLAITHYTDVVKTANSLAVAADGAKLFAACPSLNAVQVIGTASHAVLATVAVNGGVGGVAATR
jgi:YVTN family beta-propeller protein